MWRLAETKIVVTYELGVPVWDPTTGPIPRSCPGQTVVGYFEKYGLGSSCFPMLAMMMIAYDAEYILTGIDSMVKGAREKNEDSEHSKF